MWGYITGIADTSGVDYCPYCGGEIYEYSGDGRCYCGKCEAWFAVIETDDESEDET